MTELGAPLSVRPNRSGLGGAFSAVGNVAAFMGKVRASVEKLTSKNGLKVKADLLAAVG